VRRPAVIVAAFLFGALMLTGCGSKGVVGATGKVIGTLPKAPVLPIVPAFHLKGDPAKGKPIFASSNCGGCHTLAAAHSRGTVGPDLDALKPDYRSVTSQVTNGGNGMPPFGSQLSKQQIADMSAYVVQSTGGTP
jgi:mono/diheme cytochrome c family protein